MNHSDVAATTRAYTCRKACIIRTMAFHVRTVALGKDGTVAIVISTRRLKAKVLADAKRAVDLGDWQKPAVNAHAIEIVHSAGRVLAVRPYRGKNIHAHS